MSEDIAGATTNAPLARDASLSAFFEDLDITNLTIFSDFGIIWRLRLDRLDDIVRRSSLNPNPAKEPRPEHATTEPEQSSVRFSPRVTFVNRSSDENEPPWFTAEDGTRYTFVHATFQDGRFYLKTRVEKTETAPIEGEYTVEELRRMIGSLPPKPGAWKRLLSSITSLFQ